MDSTRARCRPCGFTLPELLGAVCILAVLTGVAVPHVRSMGDAMTVASFSNGFLSHLYLARSEAIKRRQPVVMCSSADGASCAAEAGWERGWIVFHDSNGNGLREPQEQLLERVAALPTGFALRGNLNVARYVLYTPSGATRTAAGAFQAGTLTICRISTRPTEARQVVLNAVGRPRLHKLTVDHCS